MPGFRNSKIDHRSPKLFSIGVPLSASRKFAESSRLAFAICEPAFLIVCASSSTT